MGAADGVRQIALAAGWELLQGDAERLKQPIELVGHGVVTKWRPDDLRIKSELELEIRCLCRWGEPCVCGRLAGLALETEALKRLERDYGITPYAMAESWNTTTDLGRGILLDALNGVVPVYYTNALAALGVGDSSAAFAGSQTNLQGAVVTTDRIRKAMDATFPSRVVNVATYRSTFATTEANFVWNEWALFNALADATGTMLNRAVANLGTKTSAASWQLTATLTIT
jgi:hypothetical protein